MCRECCQHPSQQNSRGFQRSASPSPRTGAAGLAPCSYSSLCALLPIIITISSLESIFILILATLAMTGQVWKFSWSSQFWTPGLSETCLQTQHLYLPSQLWLQYLSPRLYILFPWERIFPPENNPSCLTPNNPDLTSSMRTKDM